MKSKISIVRDLYALDLSVRPLVPYPTGADNENELEIQFRELDWEAMYDEHMREWRIREASYGPDYIISYLRELQVQRLEAEKRLAEIKLLQKYVVVYSYHFTGYRHLTYKELVAASAYSIAAVHKFIRNITIRSDISKILKRSPVEGIGKGMRQRATQ